MQFSHRRTGGRVSCYTVAFINKNRHWFWSTHIRGLAEVMYFYAWLIRGSQSHSSMALRRRWQGLQDSYKRIIRRLLLFGEHTRKNTDVKFLILKNIFNNTILSSYVHISVSMCFIHVLIIFIQSELRCFMTSRIILSVSVSDKDLTPT